MAVVHLLVQLRHGQRLSALANLRVLVRVVAGGLADAGEADRHVVALDEARFAVAAMLGGVTGDAVLAVVTVVAVAGDIGGAVGAVRVAALCGCAEVSEMGADTYDAAGSLAGPHNCTRRAPPGEQQTEELVAVWSALQRRVFRGRGGGRGAARAILGPRIGRADICGASDVQTRRCQPERTSCEAVQVCRTRCDGVCQDLIQRASLV